MRGRKTDCAAKVALEISTTDVEVMRYLVDGVGREHRLLH